MKMKVENMTSSAGNKVANQFILKGHNVEFFQSYNSIIAKREWTANGKKVTLDKNYWEYSVTTGKYRNQFLGESKADTRAKIESGEYKLENLN